MFASTSAAGNDWTDSIFIIPSQASLTTKAHLLSSERRLLWIIPSCYVETVPQQFLRFYWSACIYNLVTAATNTYHINCAKCAAAVPLFQCNNATSCIKAWEKVVDILINLFESAQGKFKGHWNLEIEYFYLLLWGSGYFSGADGLTKPLQSPPVDRKTNTDQQ